MNERIKELAFEANKDLDGNVPIGFAGKFAELILQECKLFCGHDSEGVSAMFKHFGVEE